jgi:hypothetical protein
MQGYLCLIEISLRPRTETNGEACLASRIGDHRLSHTVRALPKRLARSNGDTVEASTFASSNGNNLNGRRDDEELFPRLILELDAYYYQRASPVGRSFSAPLCDLYRSREGGEARSGGG